MSALTDYFTANLTCKPMYNFQHEDNFCRENGTLPCTSTVTIKIPDETCNPDLSFRVLADYKSPATNKFGIVRPVQCKDSSIDSTHLGVFIGSVITEGFNQSARLDKTSFWMCDSTYQIMKVNLTLDSNGVLLSTNATNTGARQLNQFSPGKLVHAVYNAAQAAAVQLSREAISSTHSGALGPIPKSLDNFDSSDVDPMLVAAAYGSPAANFEDETQFQNAVQKAFNMAAVHVASRYLLKSETTPLNGSYTHVRPRIVLNEVPLRLMEVCAGLLIVISLALIKLRPMDVTPRDPSSVGGLATILAQSPETAAGFRGLVTQSTPQVEDTIGSQLYSTAIVPGEPPVFLLLAEASDEEIGGKLEAIPSGPPTVWWNPLVPPFRIMVLVVCIAFIVAVELIGQQSKRADGLADAPPTGIVPFIVVFLPAMIFTVFGGVLSILDYYTRLLQPYDQMKKTPSTARRGLLLNYLSKVTAKTIAEALSNKHFAVVLTGLVAFITPFLVILVGGLFIGEGFKSFELQGIMTADVFDALKLPNANQSGLQMMASLPQKPESNYPPWTFDVFAFQKLTMPNGTFKMPPAGRKVSPTVHRTVKAAAPAIRASLNCSRIPGQDVRVYVTPPEVNLSTAYTRHIAVPVPEGCGVPCRFDEYANTCDGKARWEGDGSMQTMNGSTEAYGSLIFANAASIRSQNASCPRFSLLWGKNSADGKTIDNLVAFNCYPVTHRVSVETQFQLPTWTVLSAHEQSEPAPTVFEDVPEAQLDPSNIFPLYNTKDTNLDSWFGSTVESGQVKVQDFLSESNVDSILAALNRQYGLLMAQSFHLNRRSPGTDSQKTEMAGVVVDPVRMRIKQDMGTTRALQVLLGLIFVFTIASYKFLDTRAIVPHNPATIAGTASLIAESEVIKHEMAPRGSEWKDDRSLGREGVFSGYLFSLGMWDVEMKVRKVFGIGVGDAERIERD